MIDYIKYFFNPTHLFSMRPPIMQNRAIIILFVIFGIFIILGIVSKTLTKKKDSLKAKAFTRLFYLFLTMGILGYLYLFFAWQGIALLSGRFWLVIWLATTIVWLVAVLKYLLLKIPKIREEINKKREFERYVP